MSERTFDVDTSEIDAGDTLFVLDKDAAEYRETTVERAETVGYSVKIDVADSDRTFGTASAFDHAPGDFAHLARPDDVAAVADAFGECVGDDVAIVRDDEEDGADDPELVTDDEIEDAIERNDDPDHPEAYTVADVRDALAAIHADILAWWDEHQDAIDDGAYEIVHEDRDVIVLAEGGHFWSEQFNAMGIGDEHGILSSIVVSLQHTAARTHCEHSWSVSTPVVVAKTDEFRTGEQQVLREIARRTDELGSVARAVDTLATEVHGWSKGDWARLTGRNPSTVTRTTDN